jgi:hypothetical protein
MRQTLMHETNLCKGLCWSDDGTQLLRTHVSDLLVAEDFRTGIRLQTVDCDLFDDPIAFWSQSAKYVVTYRGKGGSPILRDAQTANPLNHWSDVGYVPGERISWSPGESAYIAAGHGHPAVFHLDGTSTLAPDKLSVSSFGVAWHPSGNLVALGNLTGIILLRDPQTLQVISELKGHTSRVEDLCFSPNGRRLASCGDRTVRIWDVATGLELIQLSLDGTDATRIRWSPDGIQLAVGTTDGKVVLFGSNDLPLPPIKPSAKEPVSALSDIQNWQSEQSDADKPLPWRKHYTALKKLAGRHNAIADQATFHSNIQEWLSNSHFGDAEHRAFVQAWLVLIEAHTDHTASVQLADRLRDFLRSPQSDFDKETGLNFQFETLMLAGQRAADLGDNAQAEQYLANATAVAEQLTTSFSVKPTYWRKLLSVVIYRTFLETKNQILQLQAGISGEASLASYRRQARELLEEMLELSKTIPGNAFFYQPPPDSHGLTQVLVNVVSNLEIKNGIELTFYEEWTRQFLKSIQGNSKSFISHYELAICHLMAGKKDTYREDCKSLIENLREGNDARAVYYTCRTVALAPNGLDDYTPILELAKRLETSRWSSSITLGALLYRAGKIEEARDFLLSTVVDSDSMDLPVGCYFLAMAEESLGNYQLADDWLTKATEHRKLSLAQSRASKQYIFWQRNVVLQLLHSEASSLFANR